MLCSQAGRCGCSSTGAATGRIELRHWNVASHRGGSGVPSGHSVGSERGTPLRRHVGLRLER